MSQSIKPRPSGNNPKIRFLFLLPAKMIYNQAMSIRFNCPNCDALIGFADQHAGKRARCSTCGQSFIIPSMDKQAPQKVENQKEEDKPLPGFYKEALVSGWGIFTKARNATGLIFVAAAVSIKFFTGHTDYSFTMGGFRVQALTGQLITLAAWGCLFWYYMEIINITAIDCDDLPDVDIGGLFGFIWNVIKSLFIFSFTLFVVELPAIIFMAATQKPGLISYVLIHLGLFVFPIAILNIVTADEVIKTFRPDYFIRPIVRAFGPYLLVVGLFMLTWELHLRTPEYGQLPDTNRLTIGLYLSARLGIQMIAIITMRATGLFYRHYSCYFP